MYVAVPNVTSYLVGSHVRLDSSAWQSVALVRQRSGVQIPVKAYFHAQNLYSGSEPIPSILPKTLRTLPKTVNLHESKISER